MNTNTFSNNNNNVDVSFSEYNETEVKRKLVYPLPKQQIIQNNLIQENN